MNSPARFVAVVVGFGLLGATGFAQEAADEVQGAIRATAIVNFSFDEESGPAKDSATAGAVADEGKLVGDPARVASPFWNQTGKKAVQLDATKQQSIEIADGADVDAATAVSFGLLVVNLTEPTDAGYHGLVAKRGTADGKTSTNYGINFAMQADTFQVYIHDGTAFKVVQYSAKEALPYRKLIYLTATFQVADATKQDDDTDMDDVKIMLFANGEPLIPKAAPNGYLEQNVAWIKDVNVAGLLSSLPTTIGRSEPNVEQLSCVVDEFSLFDKALTPAQAKRLFLEVAGNNVMKLIAADKPVPAILPVIGSLSQPGLQVGQATQLIVNGTDLGPDPTAVFPLPGVQFAVAEGSLPNQLKLNVTVPADTTPGIYPLWVKSQAGVSKSVALALDRLPQVAVGGSTPAAPAALPAAFFGSLSGGQQHRVYFNGTKGQRVVADVELKRLGGAANPVVEIKSPAGTPLAIGWGQSSLKGDARAEIVLPSDGVYHIELHDLTFGGPGQSAFRLKVGDLKLVDAVLPAAFVAGAVEVEPIGSGFAPGTKLTGMFASASESASGLLSLPMESGVASGVPSMSVSRGTEIVEAARSADGVLQTVDATFAQVPVKQVAISGRTASKNERDRFQLNVTAGQRLKFTLQTDSVGSTLEGEIAVFANPPANAVAQTSDQPTIGDPSLEYAVPADVTQVVVQVRDLFGRGDPRAFYRLVIEPAGQPTFSLMLNTPTVNLPEDGSAIVEMQITRAGYAGPIKLGVVGDKSVAVSPNEIAANMQGKALLRLVRTSKPAEGTAPLLRLVGESVGADPAIKQTARLQTGVVAPTFTDTMAVGTIRPSGLGIELQQLPAVLFRGVSHPIPIVLKRQPQAGEESLPVKLSLDSTEPVRRRDPNNPAAGNFPLVAAAPQMIMPDQPEQATVKIVVPLESAEPVIDFVVKAEATPHAYSDRVLASAFSQPFRAEIKHAVAPKVDDATLAIVGEADHKITGLLQRTPGFTGPVEVTLTGLPAGYTVQPATVVGDQDKFEFLVKAPKVEADTPVANIKLRVTSSGSLLTAELPVSMKVVVAK